MSFRKRRAARRAKKSRTGWFDAIVDFLDVLSIPFRLIGFVFRIFE